MPSENLYARFFVGYDEDDDLFADFIVYHLGSANLFTKLQLRQDTEDLFADFMLRQDVEELPAHFYARAARELVEFDAPNKWIKINNFYYTIAQASSGHTQVIVNEVIETNCPAEGTLFLGTETAWVHAYRNFTSGWNWGGLNWEEFAIISPAGGPSVIRLDELCNTRAEVVTLINNKLRTADNLYDHSEYIEVIADPYDALHIIFRCKNGFEGSSYGFILYSNQPYGHPGWPGGERDAMYTFQLPTYGQYLGESDTYEYSSFSGSTFNLDTPLTQNYTPYDPVTMGTTPGCVVQILGIQMLDIYSEAMEWAALQLGIDDLPPMESGGKFELGGGIYTDSIFVLANDWKLKLPDGTYQFTFFGTTITDDGTRRVDPNNLGTIDEIFQVATAATIIEPILSISDLSSIAQYVWSEESRGDKVDLLPKIESDIEAIRDVERGRWEIKNNQWIFYDEDLPQANIVAVFNLYDALGQPAESGVVERRPIDFENDEGVFAKLVVNHP